MFAEEIEDHYEYQRIDRDRCPKCGSANLYHWDESHDDDGEWIEQTVIVCRDCPYSQYWGEGDDAVFILPGDPGSHDQTSDYDAPDER